MNVGQLIRDVRLDRGLDQGGLASRAGTTQTYVSRIERGAVSPSWKTVERLLHAMGQRAAVTTEPLSPGNVTPAELRADLRELTSVQRVERAMELSSFLTDVAVSAEASRRERRERA